MERIPKEIQNLIVTRQNLSESFYRVFDPSRLWQEWELSEKGSKRTLSGEGRHFKSYRIPSPGGGLELALNGAKSTFCKDRPDLRKAWIKDCRILKKIQHPLLPPFEVLEGVDDSILIVMPYGDDILSSENQRQPPLADAIVSLKAMLQAEGLMLDDYWQLRSCRGIPFLIDFSELKKIDAAPAPRLR